MSNRRPPEPPPSPNRPKKSTPRDGGGGGFNWRVFTLFAVAIVILYSAYHIHSSTGSKTFDFAEYQKQYYSGNLYSKNQFKEPGGQNAAILTQYQLANENIEKQYLPTFSTEKNATIGVLRGIIHLPTCRSLRRFQIHKLQIILTVKILTNL